MVILVNKKKTGWFVLTVAVVIIAFLLYKPCLKKYVYPRTYSEYVTEAAEKYEINPNLIYAVIKAESGFDRRAVSSKGACGLMQITPETAEWAFEKMGIEQKTDIFLPEINIEVGSWYLAKLTKDYNGDTVAALAAYNAGPANVNGWLKENGAVSAENIPFAETRDYVIKTLKFYQKYEKLYAEGEGQ